jgi:sugar lactone lactonase YvrE
MTISNNFFSRRIARLLRLTSALILAGCALWMGHRVPVNYAKTGAPANPLPNLRGHAAVEHLKQEGLYNSLAETAARYNATTLAFVKSSPGEPQNIVTVAGVGPYIGDGSKADKAGLNLVEGVAFDNTGNLWIADTGNNRIRMVDAASNIITTVAGTGLAGFSGDGRIATEAMLNSPSDLALDPSGNLYFTDAGNNRIRRIDAVTHVITTVAGTGEQGYSGDGRAATDATFFSPRGIALAVDGSNVTIYTAEPFNHVVRKINPAGMVSTVAGNHMQGNSTDGALATKSSLNLPFGVALDTAGNLYIGEGGVGGAGANGFSNRVRKVDAVTQELTTVVGTLGMAGASPDGTTATAALINSPRDIAFDAAGNLYFVDNGNNRVVKINAVTNKIEIVATQLAQSFFIAINGGDLYIGDRNNNRVRKVVLATLAVTTVAGGFSPDPADSAIAIDSNIGSPAGVAFDSAGNLYFSDNFGNRVLKVDKSNGKIFNVAGGGSLVDPASEGVAATQIKLTGPQGIAFDAMDNLYIADSGAGRVRKVLASTGIVTTVAGPGETGPENEVDSGPATKAQLSVGFRAIAIDPDGNLWIADARNDKVRFVNLSSTAKMVGGQSVPPGYFVTAALLTLPLGLAFDLAGNLYVTSQNFVRLVNLSVFPYTISTVAGIGPGVMDLGDGHKATKVALNGPQGIAVDRVGNLYIAENLNNRVRIVDTGGVINTVAGTGVPTFTGDGGLAPAAAIQAPRFVALDGSGNLHISEFGGSRIRRLNVAARKVSVFRSGQDFLARVELNPGRLGTDISHPTLTSINEVGRPLHLGVTGQDLGADPADPTNALKRLFSFPATSDLLAGLAFRFDGQFDSDERRLSGDAPYSIIWGPMNTWLGLKNSDDQGARFDVRVEVLRNNVVVASRLTRCIDGITQNAASAREAIIELNTVTVNDPADILSLRVSARMGTNPDETKRPGKSNAVGLRMYYDSTQRPSRIEATLALSPARNLYLHTSSADIIDGAAPTSATAKFKDSAAVSFAGGNAWKAIGTWSINMN